jgi:hypothetical protein
MLTDLVLEVLEVRPGEVTTVSVSVINTADVIDGITATIEGIDPSWYHLERPVVSLFPEESGTLRIVLTPPANALAGEYPVRLHVLSTVDGRRTAVHHLAVQVQPRHQARMMLRPSVVTGGRTARCEAIVTNEGNVASSFSMTVIDETRNVDCTATPLVISVAPGADGLSVINMRGPRPWFGQPAARTLQVRAAGDAEIAPATVTFHQKPWISRGALTIFTLAAIVALWATIFLLVIDMLRDSPAPTKAVATNFNNDGAFEVPIIEVAGSIMGTVTSQATGEGLPRITVEAYRVVPVGEPALFGSAATDDDGVYTLASLLPGRYQLRFVADGFAPQVFPAGGGPIDLEPTAHLVDQDVQLTGLLGGFVGSVAAPGTTPSGRMFTVVITRLATKADAEREGGQPGGEPSSGPGGEPTDEPGAAPTSTQPAAPDTTVPVDPEDLPGTSLQGPPPPPARTTIETPGPIDTGRVLVTPGTYRIEISSDGFEVQEFEETLGGGELKVLNTVRLGAADGRITGTVTTTGGTPLGGVKVVARSGEFETETTTPTAGDVGTFVFEGLETPRSYVLTFTVDGFSSYTVSLDLLPGIPPVPVVAKLAGGNGSISGVARDASGAPLGGIEVTVSRGAFVAKTATLTTASNFIGIGGYQVSGIPTPGTYTVTFSGTGFQPETRVVRFDAPAPQAGIDASMRRSLGVVRGTVSGPNGPVAGIDVELSDGLTPRTTRSAATPAGVFSFGDVSPGTYTLRFSSADTGTVVVIVRVAAGATVTRNVTVGPR